MESVKRRIGKSTMGGGSGTNSLDLFSVILENDAKVAKVVG